MIEGEGQIIFGKKNVDGKVKQFGTAILYVPSQIAQDSAFPFHPPEKVKIRIDGERLIIEKVP